LLSEIGVKVQRYLSSKAAKIGAAAAAVVIVVASLSYIGHRSNYGPEAFAQWTIDGIRAGSIYALVGLGFVVIHSVTGVINFAQGEFVMLGAMLCASFYELDLPLPPALKLVVAILASMAIVTVVGIVMERGAIYPARGASVVTLIIITIGATIAIRAMGLIIWGTSAKVVPAFTNLELNDRIFRPFGLTLGAQSLWIWGTVAAVFVALYFFFERTILGKALRACAVNRRAAELMGISPSRMSLLAFALAALVGAIGGIVFGPTTRPQYSMGLVFGLKGFVAAIMAGMVSPLGAVLGGLILGVAENVGAGATQLYGFKDVIAFVILILILLLRPQGLIGGGERGVEQT
jgi:branched-chain amino acid transport system permease protein